MSQRLSLAVIMNPIQTIAPKKDTTLRLLLKAQSKGFNLHYLELHDLFLREGRAFGNASPLKVFKDDFKWWEKEDPIELPLDQFNIILMRQDPPVHMEYIYATYLLELAELRGSLVVNRPQSLRDANEKLYTAWFPQCMPPTLVTAHSDQIKHFMAEHESIVLKPLNGMAGQSVFKCQKGDTNLNAIIDTLTRAGTQFCMAQRYLPEIVQGDKRILLIDGEPLDYALARIPQGDWRGNLALGAKGVGVELTPRDRWICAQVGPKLRDKGLFLVGIDVIGDYLTEINVTSPTCVCELEAQYDLDISGHILERLSQKVLKMR